ncbi:hypothetical protein DSO57_1018172 [Entomophthora muscae]|uniref:Uncharacterized protein n=1 Tax=Entomophthora muscae TaxID=34485 RepID=A0ACC2UDZ1_9FUNG|nr:hypothetical protein DSO57_1018172 [Entomophthora muscae]
MNKKSCLAYIVDPPSPRPLPPTIRLPTPTSVFVPTNVPLPDHVNTPVYFCEDCAHAPSPKLHHIMAPTPSPTHALSPNSPLLLIVVRTLITLIIFAHPLQIPQPPSFWHSQPQKYDFDHRYNTVVVKSTPEFPIAEFHPELPSNVLLDLNKLIGQPTNIMIPKIF